MERLNQATRVTADIRLCTDRIVEAMPVDLHSRHADMSLEVFQKEDANIRQHLQDFCLIGKNLEESRVLTESPHIPLVCPDGAVLDYAWQRQLAGQATDITRLVLKAFADQRRRFFPHIDSKKQCASDSVSGHEKEEPVGYKTLPDILSRLDIFLLVMQLWICSFESLFSKPCSKCGKLLAMDKKSTLILPPLHRAYRELPVAVNLDVCKAYHLSCSPR